jgi:hypothetical protein
MKPLESKQFGTFTVEIHSDEDVECPLKYDDNVMLIECGYHSELGSSKEHYRSEDAMFQSLATSIHPDFPDSEKLHPILEKHRDAIVKKHFAMSGDCNRQGKSHAYIVALKSDLIKEGIKDPQSFVDGCAESYETWANGECVGFITKDKDGEEIDSCWGFYSSEEAYQAAQENFPTRDDQYHFDMYENQ